MEQSNGGSQANDDALVGQPGRDRRRSGAGIHRWARIDLPDDEYIPVMAIQAVDKGRAVAAMDTVRSLLERYRPDLQTHETL